MNHTPHLQLNQWEKSDRIMMEDFNADNAKLDEALTQQAAALRQEIAAAKAENCWKKLLEFTTTADAAQVPVDLSGIDLTQYQELCLYIQPKVTSGCESGYFLCNNNSSQVYSQETNPRTSFGSFYCNGSDPSFSKISVVLNHDALHASILSGRWRNDTYYNWTPFVTSIRIGASQLTSLNFYPNKTTYQILSGSRFLVYGLKK